MSSEKKWYDSIPMKDKLDIAWNLLKLTLNEEDIKQLEELGRTLEKKRGQIIR